jgi:hypothetical protein
MTEITTIQEIKIGQSFHCLCHGRYRAPRTMTFVGVSDSGAFLVRCDNQVHIFINPNAPIVLIESEAR